MKKNKFFYFIWYWMPVILSMFIIFYYSIVKISAKSMPVIPHLDKLMHFTAYACITFLWWRAMSFYSIASYKYRIILSVIIAFLFGTFNEICQSLTPYRSFELLDILANFTGSIFTFIFTLKFKNSYKI